MDSCIVRYNVVPSSGMKLTELMVVSDQIVVPLSQLILYTIETAVRAAQHDQLQASLNIPNLYSLTRATLSYSTIMCPRG